MFTNLLDGTILIFFAARRTTRKVTAKAMKSQTTYWVTCHPPMLSTVVGLKSSETCCAWETNKSRASPML